MDNGRNIPTETLLTTDLVESQTTVNVSEGRLFARRGKKAGLQKGRQPSVFTEITGDKSQFYISVIQSELSPTTDSGKGREQFSTVWQINGRRQTCRFTHMLPPV